MDDSLSLPFIYERNNHTFARCIGCEEIQDPKGTVDCSSCISICLRYIHLRDKLPGLGTDAPSHAQYAWRSDTGRSRLPFKC